MTPKSNRLVFRWFQPCKDVTNDRAESIDSNLFLPRRFTLEVVHTHFFTHRHAMYLQKHIRGALAVQREGKRTLDDEMNFDTVNAFIICARCISSALDCV